jgi:hypothetical protein
MFTFAPPILGDSIELEDGLGNLILESGDDLLLESSSVPAAELGFEVIDANPVYPIPYYYWQPYIYYETEPSVLFEVEWLAAIGQSESNSLMPIYDVRNTSGDIPNHPYLSLQLFANIHFGPNADDSFAGPTSVDITEGPADVELRTE